jgi:hypothetical protein
MKSIAFNLPAFGAFITGQAGHLAAIVRGHTIDGVERPPYALLVSDQAAGEIEACEWGHYGTEIEGTSSRTNGQANTAAMLAAECPAAVKVAAIEIDGHKDWFLPSLGQLNAAGANVPELFSKKGVYWTSTQSSRGLAFVQDFETGDSGWGGKVSQHRVRAFRAIQLEFLAKGANA